MRAKAQARLKQINQAYKVLKDRRPAPARQLAFGDETLLRPSVPAEPRVPEGTLALLVYEGGAGHFPITSEITHIGRYDPVARSKPEVDLSRVDINRSVSRHHARIDFDGGSFLLGEEAGVLNGTFVNGQRLTPGTRAPLQSGDTLRFGDISLVFKPIEPAGRR